MKTLIPIGIIAALCCIAFLQRQDEFVVSQEDFTALTDAAFADAEVHWSRPAGHAVAAHQEFRTVLRLPEGEGAAWYEQLVAAAPMLGEKDDFTGNGMGGSRDKHLFRHWQNRDRFICLDAVAQPDDTVLVILREVLR